MSDMFGAPIGIDAYDQNERQNILAGLSAGKTLGEIEAQPGAMAHTAAQTRLFGAEADVKEMEATRTRKLMELMNTPGSMGDAQTDPADRLDKMGQLYEKSGMFDGAIKAYGASSQMRLRTLAGDTQVSRAALMDARTKHLSATTVGGIAQAGLTDQASYEDALKKLPAEGVDTSEFPKDFASGRDILQHLATQSMTAAEQLKANMNKQAADVAQKRLQTYNGVSAARARELGARADVLTQQYANRAKYEGENSPAMLELRRQQRETSRNRDLANQAKIEAPPLDAKGLPKESELKVGKPYTTPAGILIWGGPTKKWIKPMGNVGLPSAGNESVSGDPDVDSLLQDASGDEE